MGAPIYKSVCIVMDGKNSNTTSGILKKFDVIMITVIESKYAVFPMMTKILLSK